jgi:hypothetical protein
VFVHYAFAYGFQSQLIKKAERPEILACRLVCSWGFTGTSADGEGCALNMRAAVMREAERARPLQEES